MKGVPRLKTKLALPEVGEEPGEVVLAEVKDEVEEGAVAVEVRGPAPADLDQVHDVLVVQQLQDAHLPGGGDGVTEFGTQGEQAGDP